MNEIVLFENTSREQLFSQKEIEKKLLKLEILTDFYNQCKAIKAGDDL